MLLSEAIAAAEAAGDAYAKAQQTTETDRATADGIRAKLDAATAVVEADKTEQGKAAASFNAALDVLIAAATAAKIMPPS